MDAKAPWRRRELIDWHVVPEQQQAIHIRLRNWARWSFNRPGRSVSPGFWLYQSTEAHQAYGAPVAEPVDSRDAAKVAAGVAALPQGHRLALAWYYIKPVSPHRACREIGVTQAQLERLVHDARGMLVNRRI